MLSLRPLEDELSAVMSEPKRPAPDSSIILQASNTLSTPRKMPALSAGGPPAVSQTPLASPADLFVRQSEALTEEPGSRKRKEMEEEIQIDELESIMLEDMDCFDDKVSSDQGQEEQLIAHSLPKQKQGLHAVDASSSSKRQRIHQESNGRSNKVPQQGRGKESSFLKNLSEQSDPHTVSIKTEPPHPTDFMTTNHESRKPPEMSSASTSKDISHFEDDEASFVEVKEEDLLFILNSYRNIIQFEFFFLFYSTFFPFNRSVFIFSFPTGCRTTENRYQPAKRGGKGPY